MPVNMPFRPRYALHALLMLLALAGSFIEANQPIAAAGADISVVVTPLPADDDDQPCSGAFVTRYLPHFTSTADGVIRMFQANGSGIGAGDMDDDGDLDLVTASYDAGLLTDQGTTFLLDGGGGIVHYRNEDGRFVPTVLETEAQAMAVALQDLNGTACSILWSPMTSPCPTVFGCKTEPVGCLPIRSPSPATAP